MLAVAQVGDALEADVGKGRLLARAERLDVQRTGVRIIVGVGQVRQIAGIGLDDDVAVALLNHGALPVGIELVADIQAVNCHVLAIVHGEDGALVFLKLHRHAVGVQGVIGHAGQGQGVFRIQARRDDPVGLVAGGEAEVPLELQGLVRRAHRGLVLHAREDFDIGLGQEILVDAVLLPHGRIVQVVAVGVFGAGGRNPAGHRIILHQQVVHVRRAHRARNRVLRQGNAHAARHGDLVRRVEQHDRVAAVRNGDAARHLVEGDQHILELRVQRDAARYCVVLHHGFAAPQLHRCALGLQHAVHNQRTRGDGVGHRLGAFPCGYVGLRRVDNVA